ncbi:MCE family protein [bacterium]|nr:MCE family protein [bacterium]
MAKVSTEVKVGLMVGVGLVMLAGLLFYFGRLDRYLAERSGYEIKALFYFTAGLEKGAPVRLAGVEVGRVKDIKMTYHPKTKVEVSLWLRPGVEIREGATAFISTLGLMGEKGIEITPGEKEGNRLVAGSEIASSEPVRYERLVKLGEEIVKKLSQMVDSVGRIIGDEETEEALRETIRSSQVIIRNLETLTADLNKVLGESGEDVIVIIENFREISEKLKKFAQELEEHPTILLRGKRKSREQKKTPEKRKRQSR